MPDQGIRDVEDVGRAEAQTDCIVIGFMLRDGWPWTVAELAREFDSESRAADSVRRLAESGLAHRVGDLVFPTHAARRAADIEIGTF